MSLDDLLDFEAQEINGFFDLMAGQLKDEEFNPAKLLPRRISQLSELMTVEEKHLFVWEILLNSTPKYRKAASSRLRKIVAEENTRPPVANENHLTPSATHHSSDIKYFIKILKDINPWWYVLNVDHNLAELSRSCYDSVKQYLNPIHNWVEIWHEILPIIGTVNSYGIVRLKPI